MSNEEAWIIRAEWVNSSPTYHGPFAYVVQAEQWAERELSDDGACLGYELGVLTPTAVAA